MKYSKLSLLPILIALILILSAVSESGEQKTKSEQVRTDKHKNQTDDHGTESDNKPDRSSQFQVEILEALRAIAKQNKTAYEQGRADEKSWDSPSVLVNIGLFIVGAAYTFFAWRQWLAIDKQAEISATAVEVNRQAVQAAAESAKVAQLALTSDRPYIFIESQRLFSDPMPMSPPVINEPTRTIINISIDLRNQGKGLGIIKSIRSRLVVASSISSEHHKIISLNKAAKWDIRTPIIGSGDIVNFHHGGYPECLLPTDVWERINNWELEFGIIILVSYSDVFKKPHMTIMEFDYHPRWQQKDGEFVRDFVLNVAQQKRNHYT